MRKAKLHYAAEEDWDQPTVPDQHRSTDTTSRLLTTALAQNSSCQGYDRGTGNVNSTGQHEFTWNSSYATDDPWYISVLVGFRGSEWNDVQDIKANSYICTWKRTQRYQNLSACVDHLVNALGELNGGECPSENTGTTSDAFNKACPMLYGDYAFSSKPLDVTNDTCAYTDMPELQILDGYSTFGTIMGLEPFKTTRVSADANQAYDILTRQTIPLVLLGRFVDPESNLVQSSFEFVCMTANKTVEGSRVPEKEKPWESAGAEVSARMVGWAAAVVTAAMLGL
ncbi:hypothetical protein PSPO01_11441 [Paraphaeosphaeria sporulosa]